MTSPLPTILLCTALCAPTAAVAAENPNQPPTSVAIGQRMRAGIRTGDLTAGEVRRLRGRIQTLRTLAASLRAGGLDARERQQLRAAWRGIGRQVFRLRHNDIRRSGR
jgi:hypothetical protein